MSRQSDECGFECQLLLRKLWISLSWNFFDSGLSFSQFNNNQEHMVIRLSEVFYEYGHITCARILVH